MAAFVDAFVRKHRASAFWVSRDGDLVRWTINPETPAIFVPKDASTGPISRYFSNAASVATISHVDRVCATGKPEWVRRRYVGPEETIHRLVGYIPLNRGLAVVIQRRCEACSRNPQANPDCEEILLKQLAQKIS